jgi:hypothetical protein
MDNHLAAPEPGDRAWAGLYRPAGAAALILALITLAQVVIFVAAPPPLEGTAAEWFGLFHQSAIKGLLAFEGLLVVYALLAAVVALALCVALWPASRPLSASFLLLSVMGSLAFVVARPGFEMLFLSGHYAAAATEAERAAALAAGEAMVAAFHGTAFQVSYALGSLSGLLIGAAMLRSQVFGRAAPYLRIASSLLDLGLFVPTVGLFISLGSVVCLLIFNVLVARRLWQLGGAAGQPATRAAPRPAGAS